jgi:hypothetical protein
MSFTLTVVHLGARVNHLTLSILLPSVKSITVRVVCLLQCGQYIVRCRPDFVRFLNSINSSHGFVCDANPSSGLWLDAVWWKSAECQGIFRSLSISADDSDKRILWIAKMLPEYTPSLHITNSLHRVPNETVALIHTCRAVPLSCSYKWRVFREIPRRSRKNPNS